MGLANIFAGIFVGAAKDSNRRELRNVPLAQPVIFFASLCLRIQQAHGAIANESGQLGSRAHSSFNMFLAQSWARAHCACAAEVLDPEGKTLGYSFYRAAPVSEPQTHDNHHNLLAPPDSKI